MNDKIALACQNKYKEVMASGTAIGNILKEKIEILAFACEIISKLAASLIERSREM